MWFLKKWWRALKWWIIYSQTEWPKGTRLAKPTATGYLRKIWASRFREVDRRVNFLTVNGLPGREQILLERRMMMSKRRRFMEE